MELSYEFERNIDARALVQITNKEGKQGWEARAVFAVIHVR